MSSLKHHCEIMHDRLVMRISCCHELHEDADKFPCPTCDGGGILMQGISYFTARRPHQPLKTKAGTTIVSTEIMDCPACLGSGIDGKAIKKHLEEVA